MMCWQITYSVYTYYLVGVLTYAFGKAEGGRNEKGEQTTGGVFQLNPRRGFPPSRPARAKSWRKNKRQGQMHPTWGNM